MGAVKGGLRLYRSLQSVLLLISPRKDYAKSRFLIVLRDRVEAFLCILKQLVLYRSHHSCFLPSTLVAVWSSRCIESLAVLICSFFRLSDRTSAGVLDTELPG